MHCAEISEHELHAFVDRQLANERQRDVTAYLDAHPAAAKRVAVFARQRTNWPRWRRVWPIPAPERRPPNSNKRSAGRSGGRPGSGVIAVAGTILLEVAVAHTGGPPSAL